jgi:transposase
MLFNFKNLTQIHLIHKPVDFRKGVTGLNYLLYEQGHEEYSTGETFIFFSKNRKSLKILYYSKTGFELWYKKLSAFNRYKIPLNLENNHILNKAEFRKLLMGYIILEKGFFDNKTSKII